MDDTKALKPFHLAVVVDDLKAAREFYGGVLGCPEGRSSDHWVDFNFFGHQLVCHLGTRSQSIRNPVDGEEVPVPHFGMVVSMGEWRDMAERLTANRTEFIIEPQVRFVGEVGEQATMFLADPAGNHLEFKAMRDPANLFSRN